MLTINNQAIVAIVLFWLTRRIPIRKNIKRGTATTMSTMLNDMIEKLASWYKFLSTIQ